MTHLLLAALLSDQQPAAVVTQIKEPTGRILELCGDNPNSIILKADLLSSGSMKIGWTSDGEVEGDETHEWQYEPTKFLGGYSFYLAFVPDEGQTLTTSKNLTIVTASAPNAETVDGIAAAWSESGDRPNPFYGGKMVSTWDANLPKLITSSREIFGVERWSLRSPGGIRRTKFSLTVSGG
jgi:hypothetical protein